MYINSLFYTMSCIVWLCPSLHLLYESLDLTAAVTWPGLHRCSDCTCSVQWTRDARLQGMECSRLPGLANWNHNPLHNIIHDQQTVECYMCNLVSRTGLYCIPSSWIYHPVIIYCTSSTCDGNCQYLIFPHNLLCLTRDHKLDVLSFKFL